MNTRGMCRILLMLCSCAASDGCRGAGEAVSVSSPNGKLTAAVECREGKLLYRMSLEGRVAIQPSGLSIFPGVPYTIVGSETRAIDKVWKPLWGQFDTLRDHCNELTLTLRVGSREVELIIRAYDDGLGLRFVIPEQAEVKGETVEYAVEYLFDADYPMYHVRGDASPAGPLKVSSFDATDRGPSIPGLVALGKDLPPGIIPAVIDLGENVFLAILESDLYTAVSMAQTEVMELAPAGVQPGLVSINSAKIFSASYLTPWRVILTGRQAGDMIVNPLPLNLAAECQLQDTSWIKTGKSMWDWKARGYKAGSFTYGIDTASLKRIIDFGAKHNIRYFLLDWHWYRVRAGKFTVVPEINIEEVISYARERGVEVILYWDEYRGGSLPMDEVFQMYSAWGASGVKYGFRGNDAAFTAEAVKKAADHRLMIDFHDKPCPMIGVERTFPNAITREYPSAQMDAGRVWSASDFLKIVMINMITGPLDLNNGFYAINSDPKSSSRRAWSNVLESTVASENARVLICHSGLVVLPDTPEEYTKKEDLFEFIARMPEGGWDETRVLRSELTEYISIARRKGEEWFIGSVVNERGGSLDLRLDFLQQGAAYDVTFYEDAEDAHFQTNKEAYRVRKGEVRKGDVVKAVMAPGGGHSIWIRPAQN